MHKVIIITLITFSLWLLESAPEVYSDREIPYNKINDFKFVSIIFFISAILNLIIIDKKIRNNFFRILLNVFVVLMCIIKIVDYIDLNKSLSKETATNISYMTYIDKTLWYKCLNV